jgi:ubiquitin-activating enzyme E1 C
MNSHIHRLVEYTGPSTIDAGLDPDTILSLLHSLKILVIGAGGLGCELLKCLGLMGFKDIHVIDMDTIDISNLNRQFLFRITDVGKPKAQVAADFIHQRLDCTITPHYARIQDFSDEFYQQFSMVVCGLDSVDARRWINQKLISLYDPEDPSTLIPMIDGGTEGFKGQSRLIVPHQTACYECSLDMQTKPRTFPMCTIAHTPRLPEHCIQWAATIQFPLEFPTTKLDGDHPDHLIFVYQTALKRANEFHIPGVTYTLTQGVVKNIIPAIASTNAIIAGFLGSCSIV